MSAHRVNVFEAIEYLRADPKRRVRKGVNCELRWRDGVLEWSDPFWKPHLWFPYEREDYPFLAYAAFELIDDAKDDDGS